MPGCLLALLVQDLNGEEAKTKKVKLQDIQLEVPVGWKQQQPTSRLRAGQFQLPAVATDKEGAELVVYFFGGAGGGVDANLKRWIGQFAPKGRFVTQYEGTSLLNSRRDSVFSASSRRIRCIFKP